MSEAGHDASAERAAAASTPSTSGCRRSPTRVRAQGATVVDVDWRPPGGGDAELVALLRARGARTASAIEAANAAALAAIEGARRAR